MSRAETVLMRGETATVGATIPNTGAAHPIRTAPRQTSTAARLGATLRGMVRGAFAKHQGLATAALPQGTWIVAGVAGTRLLRARWTEAATGARGERAAVTGLAIAAFPIPAVPEAAAHLGAAAVAQHVPAV